LSTLIDSNIKLNTDDGELLKDINQFQWLMEKIIYLTVIWLDLSSVVSQISKFMHSPRTPHLDVTNRILRYLKDTLGKKIWMKRNETNEIYDYSDVDWKWRFNRKLTTDFCTFVGDTLVTWKSKK
jgi:hypothetical protein